MIAENLKSTIFDEKEPLILCGLSLGAVLSLELYFRQPNKIVALILIAPQYRTPTRLIDIQNFIFKLMPKKSFMQVGLTKENMISITSSMRRIDYSKKN